MVKQSVVRIGRIGIAVFILACASGCYRTVAHVHLGDAGEMRVEGVADPELHDIPVVTESEAEEQTLEIDTHYGAVLRVRSEEPAPGRASVDKIRGSAAEVHVVRERFEGPATLRVSDQEALVLRIESDEGKEEFLIDDVKSLEINFDARQDGTFLLGAGYLHGVLAFANLVPTVALMGNGDPFLAGPFLGFTIVHGLVSFICVSKGKRARKRWNSRSRVELMRPELQISDNGATLGVAATF